MRFHWQNLSDAPGRERRGFWHGRAWWNFGDTTPNVRLEWSHGRLKGALTLDIDRDEREIMLHVAVPGASYFLSLGNLPRRLFARLPFSFGRGEYKYQGGHRMIGVRIFDEAIWLSLWEDQDEWRSKDPKWMRATIRPLDLVFGKQRYSTRAIEKRDVQIPMPEGSYPATIAVEAASWIRPRWPWRPFSTFRVRTDVQIPAGIPVPGKGENDWDCGDDAIYGLGCSESTVEGAIGKVIASALKTRKRYGWSPSAKVSS